MRTIEPTKTRVISLNRRNYFRRLSFSAFGRNITERTRQSMSDKFMSLCQLGMDDYTASKLVILSYSGHKESKAKIEQFIDQKDLEYEIMLKT